LTIGFKYVTDMDGKTIQETKTDLMIKGEREIRMFGGCTLFSISTGSSSHGYVLRIR